MRASRPLAVGVVAALAVATPLLAGDEASARTTTAPAAAPPVGTAVAAALTPQALAAAAYARMTQAQRIGQLFMVGGAVTGPGSATATADRRPTTSAT